MKTKLGQWLFIMLLVSMFAACAMPAKIDTPRKAIVYSAMNYTHTMATLRQMRGEKLPDGSPRVSDANWKKIQERDNELFTALQAANLAVKAGDLNGQAAKMAIVNQAYGFLFDMLTQLEQKEYERNRTN